MSRDWILRGPGLWRSRRVAYVGQSTNVRWRLTEHEQARAALGRDGAMVSIWAMGAAVPLPRYRRLQHPIGDLIEAESALIEALAPELNSSGFSRYARWAFRHADLRDIPVSRAGVPAEFDQAARVRGVYMIHFAPYAESIEPALALLEAR